MGMMARPLGPAAAAALTVLVALLAASSCAAREFMVGGRDGWTPNPGEPHNHWAERNRFQVNDTLVFRYNEYVDGVLRVTQSHYDACDTSSPILRLGGGGESRFVFPDSGSYFFISADAGRCKAGERLIVVVLAVRSPPLPPPKPASSSAPPPKPASSSAPPPQLLTPKPADAEFKNNAKADAGVFVGEPKRLRSLQQHNYTSSTPETPFASGRGFEGWWCSGSGVPRRRWSSDSAV
ncbi:hypothetical protein QOZ80_1AG0002820 [Eleusine coracana subsp. coracana]|nr:hypothetical protein QOZ80_1AG0002820 [Eleusine coracana subsp. coracana]